MRYLFISDLHLDASAPAAVEAFIAFSRGTAREADALYILGDLFEVWIGDDDTDPTRDKVCTALRELTAAGVAVFVMQGNRDFLYGERFEARTGCTLVPDPVVAHLGGERVLLTHGDLLCTGDTAYQELRTTVRDPRFRDRVLALPLEARQWIADTARSGSKAHTRTTTANIIDSTGEMLKNQTARIHEQAASSTIPVETLQRAFQNIYLTMDQIDTFKAKALISMKTTVDTLGDEVEKSKGYIARAEGQAQAAIESSAPNPFAPVE